MRGSEQVGFWVVTAVDPELRAVAPPRVPSEPPIGPGPHRPAGRTQQDGADAPPSRFTQAYEQRPWLAPAATGVALALGSLYTGGQDPSTGGVFPGCPLRSLTGWDCPGCGGLRATHDLLHGDLVGALDHNVFLAVAVPIAALLWLRWLLRTLDVSVPRLPRVPRPVWGVLATAVLAFTVVRNIDGVGAFEYLNSFT